MEQLLTFYSGNQRYDTAMLAAFGMVLLTIIGTHFVTTPYGRFGDGSPGFRLSPRLGWFLMELPAPLVFVITFIQGDHATEPVPLVLLAIWLIHYANRGFIFPALMRVAPGHRQTFNFSVVAIGWIVTSLHGYLNGAWISQYGTQFTTAWFTDPRFIAGIVLYYTGFVVIIQSEAIMRNLRPRTMDAEAPRYRIPRGGAYRWVTNAPYLGELMAWTGFAIFTWSLAGVFILSISAANLIPRALANHRWYREQFPDYPSERKILIPFVW